MELHLSSHLSWYVPQQLTRQVIHLEKPISLLELATQLGLPPAEIAIAAVNGTLVSLQDAQVTDQDRVEFHPAIGAG